MPLSTLPSTNVHTADGKTEAPQVTRTRGKAEAQEGPQDSLPSALSTATRRGWPTWEPAPLCLPPWGFRGLVQPVCGLASPLGSEASRLGSPGPAEGPLRPEPPEPDQELNLGEEPKNHPEAGFCYDRRRQTAGVHKLPAPLGRAVRCAGPPAPRLAPVSDKQEVLVTPDT